MYITNKEAPEQAECREDRDKDRDRDRGMDKSGGDGEKGTSRRVEGAARGKRLGRGTTTKMMWTRGERATEGERDQREREREREREAREGKNVGGGVYTRAQLW